jgi:hypothetical protein
MEEIQSINAIQMDPLFITYHRSLLIPSSAHRKHTPMRPSQILLTTKSGKILPGHLADGVRYCLTKGQYIATLEQWGRARGLPQSNERHQQVRDLLDAGILSIYGWMDQHVLVEFILEQPKDYWIAACLESREGVVAETLSLVCTPCLANSGTDWLQDFSQRRDALQKESDTFMKEQSEWIAQTSRRGLKKKLPIIPVDSLDGSNAPINQNGNLRFKYRHENGHSDTIQIYVGLSLVPLGPEDNRTIHFTPAGIDIRDASGETLYSKENTATLPVGDFRKYGDGEKLVSLWEAITGLTAPATAPFGFVPPQNPHYRVTKRGSGIPHKMPTSEELAHPPLPGDALWLLNEYLNHYFPDGGKFWTGTTEFFPKSSDDVNRFLQ